MIIPIEKGSDNPILRASSKTVKSVTKKTLKFLRDMEDTMFDANGVGIAAPQVGVNDRLALALIDGKTVLPLINPEIIDASDDMEDGEEGCLSLPGQWGKARRHKAVTVRIQTLKGDTIVMKFKGFNARIMQHEIDHLNGGLFIDRLAIATS